MALVVVADGSTPGDPGSLNLVGMETVFKVMVKLPDSISELTVADVQLLLKAARAAGQLPDFMDNPEASLRLGYIVGMLMREITRLRNED